MSEKRNVPSPLLSALQETTVPILNAIPPPSHAPATHPIHSPPLTPLPILFHHLRPPPKNRHPRRPRPEIHLLHALRHHARQCPPRRNQRRGVRAQQHRPRPLRVRVQLRDNAREHHRDALVQLRDRLARGRRREQRGVAGRVEGEERVERCRRGGGRVREGGGAEPFSVFGRGRIAGVSGVALSLSLSCLHARSRSSPDRLRPSRSKRQHSTSASLEQQEPSHAPKPVLPPHLPRPDPALAQPHDRRRNGLQAAVVRARVDGADGRVERDEVLGQLARLRLAVADERHVPGGEARWGGCGGGVDACLRVDGEGCAGLRVRRGVSCGVAVLWRESERGRTACRTR